MTFERLFSINCFALLLSLILGLGAPAARADLWQGAAALPEKGMSVGIFGKVYGQTYSLPSAVMAFGEFNYGLNERTQVGTRIGIGMLDLYVGAQVKNTLLQSGGFHLAVMAGLHRQRHFFIDGYLISSYQLSIFEFYAAPIIGISLNTFQTYVGLLPGLDIAVTPAIRLYLQSDINVVGYYFAGSFGVRHSF